MYEIGTVTQRDNTSFSKDTERTTDEQDLTPDVAAGDTSEPAHLTPHPLDFTLCFTCEGVCEARSTGPLI